jgi:hypothetical protein
MPDGPCTFPRPRVSLPGATAALALAAACVVRRRATCCKPTMRASPPRRPRVTDLGRQNVRPATPLGKASRHGHRCERASPSTSLRARNRARSSTCAPASRRRVDRGLRGRSVDHRRAVLLRRRSPLHHARRDRGRRVGIRDPGGRSRPDGARLLEASPGRRASSRRFRERRRRLPGGEHYQTGPVEGVNVAIVASGKENVALGIFAKPPAP